MPTAKAKGGSRSHCYRPASEYDDAILAQKREYWRTKKREQRARLSERRGKQTQCCGGKQIHSNGPMVVNYGVSGSVATVSSQNKDELYKTNNISSASKSGNTIQDSLAEDAESQKGQIETVKLNKVMPLLPLSSCSHSTNVGGCTRATEKCPAEGVVGKTITSPKTSRLQLNTSLSVPTVRLTRIINSSSGKRASQLCASMQGTSAPRTQHMSQVALSVQPKLLSTNMKTDMISPGATVSIKIEDKVASSTPQSGTKSAMVDTSQRAKGVNKSQSSPETEEEKAAKRREQWRIKKREQRAKVAARLAKAREKTCGMEMTLQRPLAQKAGHIIGTLLQQHPLQPLVRGAAQKRCPPRVKISFASTKKENDKVQIDRVVTVNPQREPIKGKNPNISRGIVRCKTTRQRFIEPHKLLMNQRNTRCKTLLLNSVLGPRNIANSSDTPEQITAKRREYWRIKKREQRAKLSFEVKVRLKEKDSLMRRMKRFQNIPEEKWRARALMQSGNSLTHVSETIGGFIKEDGTVTNDVHQVPTYPDTAPHSSEEECLLVSETSSITKSHCQPGSKRSIQPPAPLRLPQVKIFPPLSGRSCSKPRQLLSIRPHSSAGKSVNQLTLSRPQAPPNRMPTPRINVGGAVRKMAVLNSASRAPSLDPELTEEERMARKREYWRIKKREQRAAYAARMKSGLQAKAGAALEEKAPKQVAVTTVAQGRMFTNPTKNLFDDSVPFTPNESEIKQERESMPASDLNSQPEQAVCPDIKPSTSPPHPAPHPEPDVALNADSQATTLLAVASMKKLLEESLSTVTECKSEQSDIKIQSVEETSEPEIKPNVTAISFEEDDMSAFGAGLTVETKSWQPESDILEQGPPSPHLMSTCQNSVTLPTFPSSRNENYSSEESFHSSSNVTVNCMELFVGPPSANRPQRLCTIKARHQNCCPSEPPKLHHLPIDEHSKHRQAPEQGQNKPPSAQRHCSVGKKQSGLTSLQKKREYWKLMKRKQRARIKATHSERQSECSTRLFRRNIQPPDLVVNTGKGINLLAKPAIQPKPTIAAQTAVATIVVVNPTTCNAEKLADTLQVKLPVTNVSCSNEQNQANVGSECRGIPGNPQGLMPVTQTRMSTSTDVDSAHFLLTLKPPVDAPTISQQPIDPPCQTLSPGVPSSQFQTTTYMVETSTKLAPTSTMGPPKPIPGECEQDFLRRKREYWRIKKKEQRAKKAIQEKGIAAKRGSMNWEPILPAQDLPAHVRAEQYSGQWVGVSSSEESEQLISASLDTELGSEPYPNYTAPIEDESELLFVDSENNDGDERHMSNTMWRNCYLMDYDPLNQLLVCMVCGELQYSHSLEGVRTHIDETHPDTLIMDPGEKQRILEAWDEQVSLRERFFSNQLQQHSGALAVCHRM